MVELAGIGPGPFAATILADLGADVIRVDRPGPASPLGGGPEDLLTRSRNRIEVDLKSSAGVQTVLELAESADILIEGMRPGVTERLGVGPEDCWLRNPRLVYGRMTGWGQSGPLAQSAGHDVTYLATSGVLHGLGQTERPQFPINLLGDFGGGSTFLVIGVLAALASVGSTGRGQVVDAAILDGTAYLDLMTAGWRAAGRHTETRGENLLDGGAPYYRLYRTSDRRWLAVGALEPGFFASLVRLLNLSDRMPPQADISRYPEMAALFEDTFATRTLAEWAALFEGTDACVAPVLTPSEAVAHPHLAARSTYVDVDGVVQPAPAPRFGGTPFARPRPGSTIAVSEALARWTRTASR